MVKIYRNGQIIGVSKGAYEEIYSKQGFQLLDEKKVKDAENSDLKDDGKHAGEADEVNEFAELEAKPLSEWTVDEVKAYARKHKIVLRGAKGEDEVKARIKAFLDGDA